LRRPNLTVVDRGANLETAADSIVYDTLLNTGTAGYGGIVVRARSDIYKPLASTLEQRLNSMSYGSPAESDTNIGPMISDTFRVARHEALERLEIDGAVTMFQAPPPDARTERMGWFVGPRIVLVFKYNRVLNAELPLGPTIIVQSLPGSTLLEDGPDDQDWNSYRLFDASGQTSRIVHGAEFSQISFPSSTTGL
jgi:aldehyde dehydrogenase (NAD+)